MKILWIDPVNTDPQFLNLLAIVLQEAGRSLHAKKILGAILADGLKMGGKKPIGSLITAMRRDKRIEKDSSAKNTWRLGKPTNVEDRIQSLSASMDEFRTIEPNH